VSFGDGPTLRGEPHGTDRASKEEIIVGARGVSASEDDISLHIEVRN